MPLRICTTIAIIVFAANSHAAVTLTVDSTQCYQMWEGFEATINSQHRANNALRDLDQASWPQPILDSIIEDAVMDLGLTALRLEVVVSQLPRFNGGAELATNDNNDTFVVDNSGFRWHWFDPYVRSVVLPFKQRVEARGDKFTLDLHIVAWNA